MAVHASISLMPASRHANPYHFLQLLLFFIILCVCMCANTCHDTHVELRGQLLTVSSLLYYVDQTQDYQASSKHLYLLRYITRPLHCILLYSLVPNNMYLECSLIPLHIFSFLTSQPQVNYHQGRLPREGEIHSKYDTLTAP